MRGRVTYFLFQLLFSFMWPGVAHPELSAGVSLLLNGGISVLCSHIPVPTGSTLDAECDASFQQSLASGSGHVQATAAYGSLSISSSVQEAWDPQNPPFVFLSARAGASFYDVVTVSSSAAFATYTFEVAGRGSGHQFVEWYCGSTRRDSAGVCENLLNVSQGSFVIHETISSGSVAGPPPVEAHDGFAYTGLVTINLFDANRNPICGSATSQTGVNYTVATCLRDVTRPPGNTCFSGPGTAITTAPSTLLTCGVSVRGAAADGVSELLVRFDAPQAGNVTFTLSGADPNLPDGGLRRLEDSTFSSSVTVPTKDTGEGRPKAFVIYRAPRDFSRPGIDITRTQREARLVIASGGTTVFYPLVIFRPPVLLLHGLWSNADTWRATPGPLSEVNFEHDLASILNGLVVGVGDYHNSNASHFSVNASVVGAEIGDLRHKFQHEKQAAVSQVDVVGHSMGGILSRIWATDERYLGQRNFSQGDIHKLITLDSPHHGSYLASLAWLLGEEGAPRTELGTLLSRVMAGLGMPIDRGAIEDLRIDSARLVSLRPPRAPYAAHAIVGQASTGLDLCAPGTAAAIPDPVLKIVYTALCFFVSEGSGPGLVDGDGLVSTASQHDGLPGGHTTPVDAFHTTVTSSGRVLLHLVDLLNAPIEAIAGGRFSPAGFPAGSVGSGAVSLVTNGTASRSPLPTSQGRSLAGTVSLRIVSPATGTKVNPGETITVVIEPAAGVAVATVLVASVAGAEVLAPPFQMNLRIPDNFIGTFNIGAIGKVVGGDFVEASVDISVTTTATLHSIDLSPSSYAFAFLGGVRDLHVVGTYSDGVSRDLSSSNSGTIYSSDNPAAVTVDVEGRLRAITDGSAVVTVRNGSSMAAVTVTVAAEPSLAPDTINNGGMEVDVNADRRPDGWKGVTNGNDRLVCDPRKSHSGACAFQFKGDAAAAVDTLKQVVNQSGAAGDAIDLKLFVRAKNLAAGAGKVQLIVQNTVLGMQEKVVVTVPEGSYPYRELHLPHVVGSINASLATYDRLVINVKMTGATGSKLFVDDVTLLVNQR